MWRALFFLGVVACLLAVPRAGQSVRPPPFVVGFADDLPKELGVEATVAARALGANAVRLTTQWSPGLGTLDAVESERLDRAVAAASGLRVFLSVYGSAGSAAPRDDATREQYCGFVRGVLERYPAIHDVIVWNEPNKRLFWSPQTQADGSSTAPAEYMALLARCYDVLHAAVPGVRVIGLALSSTGYDNATSRSPGAFIRGVGDAYRASGRAAPLFDAVAHHPYAGSTTEPVRTKHVESPTVAQGDWNKLMRNLALAFAGTGQPLPGECEGSVCPVIWYTEVGFETEIDPSKATAYTGVETVRDVLPAAADGVVDQRGQVVAAVRLAACQPYVAGLVNFLLADEPRLEGWQSGALWADRTPKPSAEAFRAAFAEAAARRHDCADLEGGPPSADYVPPPAPEGMRAVPGATSTVEVAWREVDDATAYRVYRGGAHVATVVAPAWTDASGRQGAYSVRAVDAAGNLSSPSPGVSP